ncbi:MAG: flavodoxin family protein [bacterium]|nr:flavodoxin family protein [bacterium]
MVMQSSDTVAIIYASTSGNTEAVVEHVARHWQPKISSTLHRAEQTKSDVITDHQFFILATSTWEHGVLNPFFSRLYAEVTELDLSDKQAAFIGLGDRRYEPVLFCEGMEKLRQLWLKKGGTEIGTALKIQGEPYSQLERAVTPWAETISSILTTGQSGAIKQPLQHSSLLSVLKRSFTV